MVIHNRIAPSHGEVITSFEKSQKVLKSRENSLGREISHINQASKLFKTASIVAGIFAATVAAIAVAGFVIGTGGIPLLVGGAVASTAFLFTAVAFKKRNSNRDSIIKAKEQEKKEITDRLSKNWHHEVSKMVVFPTTIKSPHSLRAQ